MARQAASLAQRRPDLADKVRSGELKLHKALVEAGIRKQPTPLDLLRRAWGKASEEERRAFLSLHRNQQR
jgi:hypothetical protein